jgi:hypothetical protein
MDRSAPDYPDDVTVYLVVNDFGKFGKAYVETDIAEADREAIIRNFISGQYSNALRVVAFNTAEGWSRDVSEDIANEVLERAFDADAPIRLFAFHCEPLHFASRRAALRFRALRAAKETPGLVQLSDIGG